MSNAKSVIGEVDESLNQVVQYHIEDYIKNEDGGISSKKPKDFSTKLVSSPRKKFPCDMCDSQYSSKSSLLAHLRIHSGRRFICSFENRCYSIFVTREHLNIHMRHHTGEKPYVCDVCHKAFSVSSNLKTHRRTHNGEKPFVCKICQRPFSQSSSLKRHLLLHISEKRFSCAHCGKAYINKKGLKTHLIKCYKVHGFENRI